jgi:hypothetical protein
LGKVYVINHRLLGVLSIVTKPGGHWFFPGIFIISFKTTIMFGTSMCTTHI